LPDQNSSAVYALAYEEAVRALSEQQAVLDNFRTRAGILLSATAIATSFLGGQALRDESIDIWGWIAIGCFAAVACASIVVLWPRKDWEFAASPRRLLATYVETDDPLPLEKIHRDLALHMENSYLSNDRRLERLILLFRLAALLLAVEVGAWIVALAT
jgi:hypothetical protein